jgi:hypothetical protein
MKVIPKEKLKETLKNLFQSSKNNIKISSSWIKGQILKELTQNLSENIKIEIIIRASTTDDLLITDEEVFKLIDKKNIEIYLNPDLHSKFFIIDDKIAVIGSSNLTFSGIEPDEGNIETDILVESKSQIDELLKIYDEIKSNSYSLNQIKGFVINSNSTSTCDFIVLDNEITENTFITFPFNSKHIISRVANISNIPVNTFFSSEGFIVKPVLDTIERFSSIFSNKNENWRKSAFFGYFNEAEYLKIANLEILGIYDKNTPKEESVLKPLTTPLNIGILGTVNKEVIQKIFSINHAGYEMGIPVEFGEVLNTDIKAKIDFEKVASMHMAVLGTTGSGKTTFVRRVIENLKEDVKVFIFDIFNEYSKSIKNSLTLDFPSTVFPITYENIRQLFKDYGISFEERTKEEKEVAGFLKRNLKPDIDFIGYREKNLDEIIYSASSLVKEDLLLKAELIYFLEILESDFGKNAISNQKDIIELIKSSLNSKENFIIFNFENVEDTTSKINIAGLILKEIFKLAKKVSGKYTVILEEAQNFAPEKTWSEIPTSSENLAYTMAKKIAMEGRKFNLGLIAITQRPANISKYILSQLNTQVILKLVNKNDLDSVSVFFEKNKEQIFNLLPYFKPGYLYITGLAVPFGYVSKIKLG